MADKELGGGWRYKQEPKVGKLRWKSVEEKSISRSTEAVSSPVTGLMEALRFWHLLGETCFHTFVTDVLRLCQQPLSIQKFCSGNVGVQLWAL